MPRLLAAAVLALALAGCGGEAAGERAGAPAPTTTSTSTPEAPSPLAASVRELDPAVYDPAEHQPDPVAPARLRIDALGISGAPILPVGVDDAGELAVPGAAHVGWYRHGPRPGEPGVTVLAAHVAFDGVDGVFRHLADLQPGDVVAVAASDGSVQRYRVTELTRHRKEALPPALWERAGAPRLALVTCGGAFDRSERRYEDNVVAWAEPA